MENYIYHCTCHRPDWSHEKNDYCDCDNKMWEELDTSEMFEVCSECRYFYSDED